MARIINKEFLKEIIQGGTSNGVKPVEVVGFTMKTTGASCDAMTSSLVFVEVNVTVDGKPGTEHIVIKRRPGDEPNFMNAYIVAAGVFKKEQGFYEDLLKVLGDLSPKYKPNAPKMYAANPTGPNTFIAMENATKFGYKMADKIVRLTFDECALALTEIAKLHALSYVVSKQKGKSLVDIFPFAGDSWLTQKNKEAFREPMSLPYISAVNMLDTSKDNRHRQLASRLKKLMGEEYDIIMRERLYKERKWNVLNHGDFWMNNVMFKYDDNNKPTSCVMIDFQGSHVALPTVDLGYFMHTSTSAEFRTKHMSELLTIYHNMFQTILAEFSITDGFTRADLDTMWRESLPYHLVFACFALPMQHTNMPEPPPSTSEKEDYKSVDLLTLDELEKIHIEGAKPAFGYLYSTALTIGTYASERVIEVVEEMANNGVI